MSNIVFFLGSFCVSKSGMCVLGLISSLRCVSVGFNETEDGCLGGCRGNALIREACNALWDAARTHLERTDVRQFIGDISQIPLLQERRQIKYFSKK